VFAATIAAILGKKATQISKGTNVTKAGEFKNNNVTFCALFRNNSSQKTGVLIHRLLTVNETVEKRKLSLTWDSAPMSSKWCLIKHNQYWFLWCFLPFDRQVFGEKRFKWSRCKQPTNISNWERQREKAIDWEKEKQQKRGNFWFNFDRKDKQRRPLD
jgi:hypothetical protein